ncbi:substrate-binding domain-containing protein [Lyngbya aestuarii]|uniref:substrate-binding domain-containing protein n=1 Tax=Lyngbya aestuarii TaxID=118322 RepID=UPI00403DB849
MEATKKRNPFMLTRFALIAGATVFPNSYSSQVVVNPQNNRASEITLAELKKIWEPAAPTKITKWNQIRPSWSDKPLNLYEPGTDSGTFDYFTEAVDSGQGSVLSSRETVERAEYQPFLDHCLSTLTWLRLRITQQSESLSTIT